MHTLTRTEQDLRNERLLGGLTVLSGMPARRHQAAIEELRRADGGRRRLREGASGQGPGRRGTRPAVLPLGAAWAKWTSGAHLSPESQTYGLRPTLRALWTEASFFLRRSLQWPGLLRSGLRSRSSTPLPRDWPVPAPICRRSTSLALESGGCCAGACAGSGRRLPSLARWLGSGRGARPEHATAPRGAASGIDRDFEEILGPSLDADFAGIL